MKKHHINHLSGKEQIDGLVGDIISTGWINFNSLPKDCATCIIYIVAKYIALKATCEWLTHLQSEREQANDGVMQVPLLQKVAVRGCYRAIISACKHCCGTSVEILFQAALLELEECIHLTADTNSKDKVLYDLDLVQEDIKILSCQ